MKMLVTVTDEQRAWLEKQVEETEGTLSGVIRVLIKEGMKREEQQKKND